jgi:hypothetical protein
LTRKERAIDAAEAWLRHNDPQYAQRSRAWRPPQTDAMEHQGSRKRMHSTAQDLMALPGEPLLIPPKHGVPAVIGEGNYRKKGANNMDDFSEYKMNEVKDES